MAKLMGPRLLRPSEPARPRDRWPTVASDATRRRRRSRSPSGIAAAVRAQRLAAGLSMRALAARAGMSQPFLSNLENSRAMPSITTLYKIAAALGVSPRDFLPAEGGSLVSRHAGRRGHGRPGGRRGRLGDVARRRRRAGPDDRGPRLRRRGRRQARRMVRARGRGPARRAGGRGPRRVRRRPAHELAAGDVLWHVSTLAHRWTSQALPGCCW